MVPPKSAAVSSLFITVVKERTPHYSRHLGSLFLFLFTSFEELCTFVGALLSGHITVYYMASSTSGQDEPNRALWLATRAGKMEPSCPLGTTRSIPQEKFSRKPYNKFFIDQVCSVKMAGYWPRSFFREFMDLDFVSVHKHAKKELGQYLAILTSHLFNTPYII